MADPIRRLRLGYSIQDVLVEGEEKEIFFDDTKAIIDQELAERDHIFLLLVE